MTSGVPKKYHGDTLRVPWGPKLRPGVFFMGGHSLDWQNYGAMSPWDCLPASVGARSPSKLRRQHPTEEINLLKHH